MFKGCITSETCKKIHVLNTILHISAPSLGIIDCRKLCCIFFISQQFAKCNIGCSTDFTIIIIIISITITIILPLYLGRAWVGVGHPLNIVSSFSLLDFPPKKNARQERWFPNTPAPLPVFLVTSTTTLSS